MTTIRKMELMHREFGTTEGKTCGNCSNFVSGKYRDRILRKCTVYGLTHSEASDWAKRWQACGMYGKEWHGGDIIRLVVPIKEPTLELEGQIGLECE